MANIVRAAMLLGVLAGGPSLASDLYRCDFPDRRTVYQGTQCQIGVKQKAIDPTNARREQIEKSLEQERRQKLQKSRPATTAG